MISKNKNIYTITSQNEFRDLFTYNVEPDKSGFIIYHIKKSSDNTNRLYPDFMKIKMVKATSNFSLEESVESMINTKNNSFIKLVYHNYNNLFMEQTSIDDIIDNMVKYAEDEVSNLNKYIINPPTFDEMK